MTSAKLAIDGGAPLRSQPFGPKWIFGDEERRHLMEVMDNATDGWRSGFKVRAFADAFATLHGASYAVATTTGTGAIHAAVAAINPEPGDEIITTPTTDIGSVLGIILHNAIPVFADWDPETLNTDPADIERRITPRTRAILAVHLYGNPCDMGPILEIARAHDLPVIEDCSQAHLAEYRGQLVGTIGDIGCFSLGGKTLTTDQGGMIITNDEPLARRAMGFSRKGSEMDSALRSSLAPTSFRRGGTKGYAFLGDFHPMTDLHVAASTWRKGNQFVWYENRDGHWIKHIIEDNIAETRTIHAADIDGDGNIDLLGTARVGNQVIWYENPGDPANQPWIKHIIDDAPQPIHGHPVDMDGDGDLDVVMALGMLPPDDPTGVSFEHHQIVWYENDGQPAAGKWRKHIICERFPHAFEAIAADFDNDGHIEVVATAWNVTGRVAYFKHRGDPRGPWDMQLLKDGWTNANMVIAADINGNGRLDIVAAAERGSNEVRWWRNEGP